MAKLISINRRVLLAFVFCALIASCSWADRLPQPVDFPTLGRCNGTNVRLRAKPNTDSKILGVLDEGDTVVVLDETLVHGDKWYEVDHPTSKGKAYVFGKYIEAIYEESYQPNPLHKLVMNLYLTFGMTPEKATALSGKPNKRKREVIGSEKIVRINMDWGEYNLEYMGGSLTGVEVKSGRKPFGPIKIGDSTEKLESVFGGPSDSSDTYYTYQESEMVYITFNIKKGKVSSMSYQVYYDIEE